MTNLTAGSFEHTSNFNRRLAVLMVASAVILGVGAALNIRINYLGKGGTWDIYPVAEIFWVGCSVLILRVCTSMKRLVAGVVALQFLDSFVDLCAMGNHAWWGGPPVLVEWKWNALVEAHNFQKYIYSYWACTWGVQVRVRCIGMAWVVSGGWGRKFLLVALGLNVIWFTAPQDVLFYFVWCGLYDRHFSYFSYLPPEGVWNLWNMILLRVPIGVGVGALLIRAGSRRLEGLLTSVLLWVAGLGIVSYGMLFMFLLWRMMVG